MNNQKYPICLRIDDWWFRAFSSSIGSAKWKKKKYTAVTEVSPMEREREENI